MSENRTDFKSYSDVRFDKLVSDNNNVFTVEKDVNFAFGEIPELPPSSLN